MLIRMGVSMGIVATICGNCGSHLSDDFVRVFYQDGEKIEECIFCPEVAKTGFDRSSL